MPPPPPVFVKLGGSVITHKERAFTVRAEVLQRLAQELATYHRARPQQPLLVGHGSGSFGHWAARQHGWPRPQNRRAALQAIAEAAAQLHQHVLRALRTAGLPVWSFPPSAMVLAREGRVQHWDLRPLQHALTHGWVPVLYGDVVLDAAQEGAILSTEDLFAALTPQLQPTRILLVGVEPGVWQDWPRCTRLWEVLTPAQWVAAQRAAQAAAAPDVTGGMAAKVRRMLALVARHPGLEVRILSGLEPGALLRALQGSPAGTRIAAHA